MNKLEEQITADKFLQSWGINPIEPIYWDLEDRQITLNELLAEFGKLCVKQALEEQAEKAKVKKIEYNGSYNPEDWSTDYVIDKESITNYDYSNIR